MLIFNKLLVELLVVAVSGTELGYLNLQIASQRIWRILNTAGVVRTVRSQILIHNFNKVFLKQHLVITIIDTRFTQKLVVVTLVLQIQIAEPSLNQHIPRDLLQKLYL